LAESGDPSSGAASHPERITLSRVGQQHRDDRTGADDEQAYGQYRVSEQVHAESIAQQDHDEADGGGGDGQDEHSLGAPDTVEPGDEDNSWRGKECGVGDELAGGTHAAAFVHECSGEPEQYTEVYKADAQSREGEGEGNAEQAANLERGGGGSLSGNPGFRAGSERDSEAGQGFARLAYATHALQEAGRLLQNGAESDEDDRDGHVDDPHDAPSKNWLEHGGKRAGGEVAADAADAADQHQAPAAMAGGHDLRQQSIGD